MIYDVQSLKTIYAKYSNINQKVAIEAKKGNLIRIKRGLYTDNLKIDAPVIANICYSPSYISFEYALSFYGLIPEYVSMLTSACYAKKNNKTYIAKGRSFSYQSIPNEAYPYGVCFLKNEADMTYKIASKEKALCDIVYSKYPVRSYKDLEMMLFLDLRIDEDELSKLDSSFIQEIAPLYHSNSVSTLARYLNRRHK